MRVRCGAVAPVDAARTRSSYRARGSPFSRRVAREDRGIDPAPRSASRSAATGKLRSPASRSPECERFEGGRTSSVPAEDAASDNSLHRGVAATGHQRPARHIEIGDRSVRASTTARSRTTGNEQTGASGPGHGSLLPNELRRRQRLARGQTSITRLRGKVRGPTSDARHLSPKPAGAARRCCCQRVKVERGIPSRWQYAEDRTLAAHSMARSSRRWETFVPYRPSRFSNSRNCSRSSSGTVEPSIW